MDGRKRNGMGRRVWLAAAVLVTLIVGPARAERKNPRHWQPRTTSVAVFKNGLGFFMREGGAALHEGWCVAQQVPPATFGTLAIYSLNPEHTVDVVGSGPGEVVEFDGVDAPATVEARRARLASCRDLRVQLTYKQNETTRTAAGRLVSIGVEFAILDDSSNNFAVPLESITRLQLLQLPLRIHLAGEPGKKTPARAKLGMAYLRKGITWIPEYTLKVAGEGSGELTLRGTLVNEAEDLVHCDVHLVVGVPHFAHTQYMAPVAVGQVIRTIGAAVAPSAVRSQMMSRAAITSNLVRSNQFNQPTVVDRRVRAGGGDLRAATGNLPQMGGAAATDYTVYTKKNLTLRRGEKAIVTLFVKRIRYSHVYRWAWPGRMNHMLALHNQTDTAWTTGPCLAVSGQRPLTEDLLKYTPKGGTCELPVTTAVNIAHDGSQKEMARKIKAVHIYGSHYLDLVTLSGTLHLRNFQKKTVLVVVTASLPGKPLSASDGGTCWTDPGKLGLTQRAGRVQWRLELEPNESRTLTYKFERYVRSG